MEKDVVEVRELSQMSAKPVQRDSRLYERSLDELHRSPREAACGVCALPCRLGAFAGDRLVGVVRVVGDGATIVFVQDLIVLRRISAWA